MRMKLYIKNIITLAALLLTPAAWAQQDKQPELDVLDLTVFSFSYQLDGIESNSEAAGQAEGIISNGTATLTMTPAEGNYITKDQITVTKTIDGGDAQTRNTTFNVPVEITASDVSADPSGATSYTFDASDENYKYEVTANFLSRIDLSEATVAAPAGQTYRYSGQEITPDVTVTLGSSQLTKGTDFTVAYADNVIVGTATITVTGKGIYKGTASTTFEIGRGETKLYFSEPTAVAIMGEPFTAPTLNPEKLEGLEYESTNPEVATVDKTTGAVTLVAPGETTIKAVLVSSPYYEPTEASYTLTVNRAQGEGYPLWIGETQVTSDNAADIFQNGESGKKLPSYVFSVKTNTLVITGDTTKQVIESRLPELTIFLNDVSKVERIFFNDLGDEANKGKLTFSSYMNIPGKIVLATKDADGVISGFSRVDIDGTTCTYLIEPEGGVYEDGRMLKSEGGAVADTVTIGQFIKPLVDDREVSFKDSEFITTDETGAPADVDLSNTAINDILYTLDKTTGDGYDDVDKSIAMNKVLTDAAVDAIAEKVANGAYIPGGMSFASDFSGGMTFMVPDGVGDVEFDMITEAGYQLMAKVGRNTAESLVSTTRNTLRISYKVSEPTYVFVYLKATSSSSRGGTRLGRRETAHGRIYTVHVKPRSNTSSNPMGEMDEFEEDEVPQVEEVVDEPPTPPSPPTPPTAIQTVESSQATIDEWYTIDGVKIGKPTQKGVYIRNKKKIVIK